MRSRAVIDALLPTVTIALAAITVVMSGCDGNVATPTWAAGQEVMSGCISTEHWTSYSEPRGWSPFPGLMGPERPRRCLDLSDWGIDAKYRKLIFDAQDVIGGGRFAILAPIPHHIQISFTLVLDEWPSGDRITFGVAADPSAPYSDGLLCEVWRGEDDGWIELSSVQSGEKQQLGEVWTRPHARAKYDFTVDLSDAGVMVSVSGVPIHDSPLEVTYNDLWFMLGYEDLSRTGDIRTTVSGLQGVVR